MIPEEQSSSTPDSAPKINFAAIPEELQALDQWVLWKSVVRDGKATKMPLSVCGTAELRHALELPPLQHQPVALTCHKAQGSEWSHVAVIENRGETPPWQYTGVTRAQNKLIYFTKD